MAVARQILMCSVWGYGLGFRFIHIKYRPRIVITQDREASSSAWERSARVGFMD